MRTKFSAVDFVDVVESPLNNVSGFWYFANEDLAPEFGANCISKALDVRKLCSKVGMSVKTLIAQSKTDRAYTHRACLISDQEGQTFFFDPCFLMSSPVLISDDLLMDSITQNCHNFASEPHVFFGDVELLGVLSDFCVNWHVDIPTHVFNFTYSFNTSIFDRSEIRPDVADIQRSLPFNFYLRFLNKNDGFLYTVSYFLASKKIIITPTFSSDFHILCDLNSSGDSSNRISSSSSISSLNSPHSTYGLGVSSLSSAGKSANIYRSQKAKSLINDFEFSTSISFESLIDFFKKSHELAIFAVNSGQGFI